MQRIVLLLLLAPLCFCFGQSSTTTKAAPTPSTSMLSRYDLSDKSARRFTLPGKISEASGVIMSANGRLFSHDDERGVIYQIDYTTGAIIKQFSLGRIAVRGDFEDITMKGSLFYLLRSDGVIYEFPEGENGRSVEYRVYKTLLTAKNDVEGMCYDPETDALLLVCKEFPGKGYEGQRAVYSFSLKSKSVDPKPRFLLPLKKIVAMTDKGEFRPSGIARHPASGTFFLIAAHGSTIIEIAKEGTVLAQQRINKKLNQHPEGITFGPDHTLILCNDGQGGRANITLYPRGK